MPRPPLPPLTAAEQAPRDAFGRQIRAIRTTYGDSLREFAQRVGAGWSSSCTQKVERGLTGLPRRSTIESLARAVEMPAGPLLNAAGYLADDENGAAADGALLVVALFVSLSPKQKQLARRLIEAVGDGDDSAEPPEQG